MSTRGHVGTGEDQLIGGIIVTGNSVKRILIRAIGPSLAGRVNGPLADPTVSIFNKQADPLATNDDWQSGTQAAEIMETHLAPTNAKESAVIVNLPPGEYTAIVSGVVGTTGVALVEAYDLESGAAAATGELRQIDRMGNPAVNVALVPFARKDEYNGASPQEDAAGRFAGDIVATLHALGTSDANIGILAGVAVAKGDYLHLDLTLANSGPGGGNNAEAAFPNGRRLGDDTIDNALLTIINNGHALSDNVNANDVPLRDVFPFFGLSQQPRDTGVIDDNTRN